jgi:hypothetical protein
MDERPVPLSLQSLQAMSEDELRVKVLIPLFRRMGFRDVRDYHGGSLEQGKDIVMWKQTEFGRTNYAAVVKARRISGQASGSDSAGVVATQINQCFGRPYLDGSGTGEQRVQECLVVCPFEIKKEARHAIESAVGEGRSHVRYVHGADLWDLVKQHFGPRTALARLRQIGETLENASPNYRVVATAKGAQLQIGVEPKHSDALVNEPLSFHFVVAFPSDETGQTAMADFVRHIETGSPVQVEREYVRELKLPDVLTEILGDAPAALALGPSTSERPARLDFEVTSDSGDRVVMSDLEFRCVQKGTRQGTFLAERGPYHVRFVLHREERRVVVNIAMNLDGANVSEALESVRLQRVIASGCTFYLRDSRTRLILSSEIVPPSGIDPGDEAESFFADLVFIQERTKTPIQLPARDVTVGDERQVRALANGLRTGVAPLHLTDATATIGRLGVEQLVGPESGGRIRMSFLSSERVRVLDTEVAVGPVATVVQDATLPEQELTRLRQDLSDSTRQEFKVRVDCSNAVANALYLRHLPHEILDRYCAMFPNLRGNSEGS